MGDILSAGALAALIARGDPEGFGPNSPHPLLAFALAGSDAALGEALAALPCPVIGIGAGPLAAACDVVLDDAAPLATIAANVRAAPFAAMVLVQHLRLSEGLPLVHALAAESLAFATLQTGPDFRNWQVRRAAPYAPPAEAGPPLLVERDGARLRLTFNRPRARNAIGDAMRDALVEALRLAAIDDAVREVVLAGAGRCFSVGGDVGEFGRAADPATAHWVRSIRLPARVLAGMREKLSVRIAGGAIGAGLEIAAFAPRITATRDAWFQLPELKYGLIPGAGGTVSVPRRIGRQRTAYMALSMRRIAAPLALAWGLIDGVE